MSHTEIEAILADLLAPPGQSPGDYGPVTSEDICRAAFLIARLPSASYLPVALPARGR